MAITGLFLSDFDDFVRGTKEADAALGGMDQTSKQLTDDLGKSLGGLDIQRLLNDPVKEGSALLGDLAASMGPLGQVSVIAAGAIAAVGTAAYGLASSTAKVGAELGDLADKTGLSVPRLSQLANVAQLAGVDLDRLSNAIFTMQKRMATNPEAFAKGLQDIGINAQQFFALEPDEQLYAIANALKAQEDPLDRIKAGTALLGAQYREMGPAINDVAEAQERAAGMKVWTADDVAQADKFQLHVNEIKAGFKTMGEDLGRILIPAFNDFFERLKDKDGVIAGFLAANKRVGESFGYMQRDIQTLAGTYDNTLPKVAGLAEVNQRLTASTDALHPPTKSLTDALAALKDMTQEDAAATKAAEAEQSKMAAAMTELNAAGTGWQGTLAGLNGDTVAAIKYYLDAGVAQGTLATAYGLTDVQVKAVAASLRDEQQAQKDAAQIARDSAAAIELAATKYQSVVEAASRDTMQTQINNIWRVADEQINALARMGTGSQEAYDLIVKTAEQAVTNLKQKTLEQEVGTKAYYERLASQAEIAYSRASASADQYTAEHLERLRTEAEAAKTTLADWQTAANQAFAGVKGAAQQAGEAVRQVTEETKRLWGTMAEFQPGQVMAGGNLPAGIKNVQERSIMAGGLEIGRNVYDATTGALLAVLERKGGAGGFLGWGYKTAADAARVNNIIINGSVLSDADKIAQVVGDALAGHYSRGGNRLPV